MAFNLQKKMVTKQALQTVVLILYLQQPIKKKFAHDSCASLLNFTEYHKIRDKEYTNGMSAT